MTRLVGLLVVVLVVLAGCAGVDAETQDTAERYCRVMQDLDEYDNPEGWDRCVEDNLEAAAEFDDCLERVGHDEMEFLSREASRAYSDCSTEVGW